MQPAFIDSINKRMTILLTNVKTEKKSRLLVSKLIAVRQYFPRFLIKNGPKDHESHSRS